MTMGLRKPGEFCWINMITPQPAGGDARSSRELLGWTYFEMPGIGHGVRVGGHDIGGLFDLDGPNTPPGTPPHIGVMVKVESADAVVEKVAALGGKAKPPFDIMDQGRMAVCFDPNGAEFDLWEPKKSLGTDVDSQPARRAELVRDVDDRRRPRDDVLLRALRLDPAGDADAGPRLHDLQAGRRRSSPG